MEQFACGSGASRPRNSEVALHDGVISDGSSEEYLGTSLLVSFL